VPRTGTQPLAVPAAWGSPWRRSEGPKDPVSRPPRRGDRFPRSAQEPRPRSRHLHAGHHLASQQAPARLIPGLQSIPGFDVSLFLRHVISGSLALAFVIHTCRAQGRDFSHDAHHHGSLPQQLGAVCGLRLHGGRGGPPGPKARLLHLLHSTASSDPIFYIQPPSTFVAHLWTNCDSAIAVVPRCSFRVVATLGTVATQ
jgi:hypothetical protein